MNYFEFYGIPVSFKVDAAFLKKTFYANSKKYHPDFYTLEDAAKQAEILELSTLNNEAYKTLSDFDKRVEYVLKTKGIMNDEGQNQLPQDFLVDMMDINEALMELEFDFDAEAYEKVSSDVKSIENQILDAVKPILESYNTPQYSGVDGAQERQDLEQVKIFFLKKRYLLRIQENLSKFATLLR